MGGLMCGSWVNGGVALVAIEEGRPGTMRNERMSKLTNTRVTCFRKVRRIME